MSTPRINWINEQQATGELAILYGKWFERNPGRPEVPGILKSFSQRPDFLRDVMEFSNRVHFSEGHLTRRVKEMIATYVSALNRCPY
jgi:alkylhydroperoxidase family enzyme